LSGCAIVLVALAAWAAHALAWSARAPQPVSAVATVSVPPATSAACSAGFVELTFDDGPSADVTPAVLGTLRRAGALATFFVSGEMVRENPEVLRQVVADGHRIGNHAWDHPDLTLLGEEDVEAQLVSTQREVERVTGTAPTLWRPPYGSSSPLVDGVARRLGLEGPVGWDISPGEADTEDPPTAATVTSRVLSEVEPDSVILLHDAWAPRTSDALPAILDGLARRGYCVRL
jgi:peptidoglycan/xylan/chitin deacetylase (PgdA/CDA1 family)